MSLPTVDRRSFLKNTFLTTLALTCGSLGLAGKPAAAIQPGNRLSLLHLHTGEQLTATFRDKNGYYIDQALKEINWLLRCHHTDEVHPIDTHTIEYLSMVDQKLGGGNEFHVVSGYRSPEYNEQLRRRGRQVARLSLHLFGRALDVRAPGIETQNLRRAALDLQMGGVGYYPRFDFVHLDSGAVRSW